MTRILLILLSVMIALAVLGGMGWLLFQSIKRSEDPARVLFKWTLTLIMAVGLLVFASGMEGLSRVVAVPACVAFGVVLSFLWAPHLGALIARSLTSLYDGGQVEPDPAPLYSIAEARRKQGRYQEAVQETQRQLAQFPNDVYGQMLLAEIQAENLEDLPSALLTIERLLAQPGHAPKSIAYALTQIADWHLKYSKDADAARQALIRIVALFPGTELAQLASHRIAHLGTTEELIASRDRTPIHLPEGAQNVGLLKNSSVLQAPAEDPAAQAAEYVRHLEQHPFDSEVREKLALIYAGHYERLDLAADQLEQLIQQPNQPAKQVAHSLNLLADLQIQHARDYEAARQTLQRIVDLYPDLAAAGIARQRMAHLKLEIKGKEQTHLIKLGTYEQNIGLKKR